MPLRVDALDLGGSGPVRTENEVSVPGSREKGSWPCSSQTPGSHLEQRFAASFISWHTSTNG